MFSPDAPFPNLSHYITRISALNQILNNFREWVKIDTLKIQEFDDFLNRCKYEFFARTGKTNRIKSSRSGIKSSMFSPTASFQIHGYCITRINALNKVLKNFREWIILTPSNTMNLMIFRIYENMSCLHENFSKTELKLRNG